MRGITVYQDLFSTITNTGPQSTLLLDLRSAGVPRAPDNVILSLRGTMELTVPVATQGSDYPGETGAFG